MKTLVTGGAGFIGSHLVDRLVAKGENIIVFDNLSSGKLEFIQKHIDSGKIKFVKADLMNPAEIDSAIRGCDMVWHLAANPDVKLGASDTRIHLDQNIIATYNLLESMRKNGIKKIGFTSTSTVYGEATQMPTPENYGPCIPISLYGASKSACEALISAYCGTFDMESVLYRFANIIGPRSTHGVIFDFIRKLKANPSELEILGDGKQTKSYCYIDDCVDSMLFGWEHRKARTEVFNVGSSDGIDVKGLADVVVKEMGLKSKYKFTGGVDGGRGWKGDVKMMMLSIEALGKLGWKPKYTSARSIALTARSILGKK
ncbi:MAG: NAD-dependent epimerase/dehydratase family protein [Candidatus Thermoplasmatota archaeon]|nr:NAD-dependent epimerase/dehydratase family protein [Candidatus Thermoplasmatota archaeon]